VKCKVTTVGEDAAAAAEWLALPRRACHDFRFRGGQPRHEPALLRGDHPLSADLEFTALLAWRRQTAIGRCALAHRPGEAVARLGLFEVLEDAAAPALFEAAEELAATWGCVAVRGPFDPDYWVGYRMRLDHFEVAPFFGEPSNPPRHPRLWETAGYSLTQRYSSSILGRPATPTGGRWSLAAQRDHLDSLGVEIRPLGQSFDSVLPAIHRLVSARFAVMPEFHPLPFGRFVALTHGLGRLADRRATALAWANGRLVGFSLVVADYGRWLDAGKLAAALALTRHRLHSPAYVCPYLAVDQSYHGVGPALALHGLDYCARRRSVAIGALIHSSAPTAGYFGDQVTRVHHYGLFEKPLD
jgi:GNAT superfamily N-acetyltransferase